jgi:KUP system potassium uptake protein
MTAAHHAPAQSGVSQGEHAHGHTPHGSVTALTVAAIGIVFGDIGTSPLYALNLIFFGHGTPALDHDSVIGGISLVLWTLTIIVTIKYAIFVLRAQNDGEGGVFALYGLLHPHRRRGTRFLLWALMLGAGLLFGDGLITPAISVLSAVEGLSVATPGFANLTVPITIGVLTGLFALQYKGTAGIGGVFGPILIVWFVVIAGLGLVQIEEQPGILAAFNPTYGIAFLLQSGPRDALLILGALMLVVTGGEAMYADLGHFGARPIRLGWIFLVWPALTLNYLGQGALLLGRNAGDDTNTFFAMVPRDLLYPMVLLATAATVIASQALISGAFTLAAQAIRLGLFPRLAIRHTHHAHAGQIYMPFVNWSLWLGCIALVIAFGSSEALGSAYGLAVAGVMVITSIVMIPVSHYQWGWTRLRIAALWGPLTLINGAFLAANTLKFLEGGFVPLTIGALVFLIMITWQWGRTATFAAYSARPAMTMEALVRLHLGCTVFMERNAILMAPKPLRLPTDRAPALLRLLWERYGILPRNMVFVEVTHLKVPYIHEGRYQVTVFHRDGGRGSIIGVELRFGYMEEPNVEHVLEDLARHEEIDLPPDARQWIVHVSLENLLPSRAMGPIGRLRFKLFVLLRQVSQPAYYYYGLGDQMRLSAEIMPVHVR